MGAATARQAGLRGLPREVPGLVEGFERNDLLLFASAISFQVLTAIPPLLLSAFGVLGFLSLSEIWSEEARPHIAESVSPAVLSVMSDTVERVLGSKQLFWVTIGAALAIWQLSGAVRAAMDALNRVHGVEEDRPWPVRWARSLILAVLVALLVLAAAAVVTLGPLVYDEGPFLQDLLLGAVRWGAAGALVLTAIVLLVRHGPNCPQPLGWVSIGSALVMGVWLAMSAGFLVYLTAIASYGSLFGNLATVVVLMGYLYASAVAFLAGIQMDALLRERHGG